MESEADVCTVRLGMGVIMKNQVSESGARGEMKSPLKFLLIQMEVQCSFKTKGQ